jgi:tetratricopeptide (TPR) repeat protein
MALVNFYEVLELDPGADAEAIRTAVRKQRREWRNRSAHPKAETRALAERMTEHIAHAEDTLLDPARRAAYDQQLAAQLNSPQKEVLETGGRDWITVIRQYLVDGNPSAANYAAREATSQQPSSAEGWYLRGTSSALLRDLADAEFAMGEAIRLDPNNASYHAELGDLYASAEDWRRAQDCYQRASDLEPHNQYFRVGMASMLSAQGRPDLALPTLEAAVRDSRQTELFRYHLAIALIDDLTDKWSRFADGSSAILNSAQLDLTRTTLARVEELDVDEPDLNQHVADVTRLAADAERVAWSHSTNLVAYGFGMVGALFLFLAISAAPLIGIAGVAALVAIPVVYAKRHHVPGYVRDARQVTDFVRSTGVQPAPGHS